MSIQLRRKWELTNPYWPELKILLLPITVLTRILDRLLFINILLHLRICSQTTGQSLPETLLWIRRISLNLVKEEKWQFHIATPNLMHAIIFWLYVCVIGGFIFVGLYFIHVHACFNVGPFQFVITILKCCFVFPSSSSHMHDKWLTIIILLQAFVFYSFE